LEAAVAGLREIYVLIGGFMLEGGEERGRFESDVMSKF
jgi:hypothetical protein